MPTENRVTSTAEIAIVAEAGGGMESRALRVLVVEDDADTAATLALLLRLYGYQVEITADGSSALQVVCATRPDVVLLDIGLPKMDGWAVAKQIREQTSGKKPLVVAVSGYGTRADQRRSQEAGIDLHFVKPVEPAVLLRLLKRFQGIAIPI